MAERNGFNHRFVHTAVHSLTLMVAITYRLATRYARWCFFGCGTRARSLFGGNSILHSCFELRADSKTPTLTQITGGIPLSITILRLKATDSSGTEYFSNTITACCCRPRVTTMLDYEDKTYSAGDGVTITANYNGLTDPNNNRCGNHTDPNAFATQSPTFTWYSRTE